MSSPPDADRAESPRGGSAMAAARRWLATPEFSVLLVLAALLVFLAARGRLDDFTGEANRDSLARSVGLQSVFSIGELLVILTGGIDLSIGSMIAFGGMLLAAVGTRALDSGMPVELSTALAMAAVLAFSAGLGAVHASLVHRMKLPPFVVTLASMSILRSAAQLLNNAVPIPIERFPLINYLGNGKLFIAGTSIGLPVSTIILAVIATLVLILLTRTSLGRHVYAVGSNEAATGLSGVNVYRVKLFVYIGCSLLAGLASILYAGYGGQGDPSSGNMFELNAISAAVIGGAVLTGGRGSVVGTVLGALLLEWILSIINLTMDKPTLWRGTVVGSVLLTAVVINQIRLFLSARKRS